MLKAGVLDKEVGVLDKVLLKLFCLDQHDQDYLKPYQRNHS